MVALTFDDGPSKHTPRLLEILQSYNARGTFFVIGNQIAFKEFVVEQMIEQGSEVMGHSWDHKEFTRLTNCEIKQQLEDTNNAIYEVTKIKPTMYRLPYGSVNEQVQEVSKELGLTIVAWSIDTRDWKSQNPDDIFDAVISTVNDGAIILTHDIFSTTVDAMERIIPELINIGYQLVTVSELLSFSERDLSPGNVINRR